MERKAGVIATCLAIGLGIGGVAMYFWDPAVGRRRRAHIRYEARRVGRRVTRTIDRTAYNVSKVARLGIPGIALGLVPARARAFIGR